LQGDFRQIFRLLFEKPPEHFDEGIFCEIKEKGKFIMAINITKDNFQTEVANSAQPVLVDFWASWCGPCRMLAPVIDELALERTDIKVGKVNVDDEPELARQFGVMSIPTLIVFENGQVKNQSVGVVPKETIEGML